MQARGRIVCYLCDRDLWLPNHLEHMAALLEQADYAHSLPLHILPEGRLRTFPVDLGNPGYRYMMLNVKDNRIPFSCFGHTLAAYRALPEGWATTPDGFWTDLHMFRKFFAAPALTGKSGLYPTAATFPSPPRLDWNVEQRSNELEQWHRQLSSVQGRLTFERDVLAETVLAQRAEAERLGQLTAQLQRQVAALQQGSAWGKFV
jgi:hypothetical protein